MACTVCNISGRQLQFHQHLLPKLFTNSDPTREMPFNIYKRDTKKDTWEGCTKGTQASANVEALILRAIGKEHVVPGHKPALYNNQHKDDDGPERLRSSVLIKRTARLMVMAKSTCSVVLLPEVVENDTSIPPLPSKATAEDAEAKANSVGDLSLGIVAFKQGYALRYLESQEKGTKALTDTKQTAVCGIDVMLADRRDGSTYIIKNVCKSYDAAAFAKTMHEQIGWPVRVDRIITKARYYNEMIVLFFAGATNLAP